MKILSNKQQLSKLESYPKEVLESIKTTLDLLDENYGVDRDIAEDLGGYVIVAETITDVEEIEKNILRGIVSEYTDVIESSEGVNWTSSLFLISSDYSIIVVTTEELSKFLLK
ncbi:Uncharacterised protein [uncultured Clostridium sp.]|uniref:hypothetical protein n=1 Tax=uncultured Clostridium sp. TaxID=59620 RepID=UPI0008204D7A|nr:hypothetical protein [uncultured Clostridium sp.]SCK02028.1 Uncharacterised protein [uncultured Clostridium sp.]